jgi:hypothetical protein
MCAGEGPDADECGRKLQYPIGSTDRTVWRSHRKGSSGTWRLSNLAFNGWTDDFAARVGYKRRRADFFNTIGAKQPSGSNWRKRNDLFRDPVRESVLSTYHRSINVSVPQPSAFRASRPSLVRCPVCQESDLTQPATFLVLNCQVDLVLYSAAKLILPLCGGPS